MVTKTVTTMPTHLSLVLMMSLETPSDIYVVVQFHPWFKFYFPLCLGMVMYDNEFETKENKI